MLEYEGKALDSLSLEDTIEFEKVVLKRLRSAGMMSEQVQNQLQMYEHLFQNIPKSTNNRSQNRSERQGRLWMPEMVPKLAPNGAKSATTGPRWSQKH